MTDIVFESEQIKVIFSKPHFSYDDLMNAYDELLSDTKIISLCIPAHHLRTRFAT